MAPAVEAAGNAASGCRRAIQGSSLRGPHAGCFCRGVHDQGLDLRRGPGVLRVPDAGPVVERVEAAAAVAGEPLVAGLTGDAEPLAQLGHGVEVLGVEGGEAGALGHGAGVGPGHGG